MFLFFALFLSGLCCAVEVVARMLGGMEVVVVMGKGGEEESGIGHRRSWIL